MTPDNTDLQKLIDAQALCSHKRTTFRSYDPGHARVGICRHKPSECEYKRLLNEEQKKSGQAYHRAAAPLT